MSEGFKDFDGLREYSITNNQFRRGLMTARVVLSNADAEVLCSQYADPKRPGRALWKVFCDDVDEGLIILFIILCFTFAKSRLLQFLVFFTVKRSKNFKVT